MEIDSKKQVVVIDPIMHLLLPTKGQQMLKKIEKAGRTCYQSDAAKKEGSENAFVAMLIERGHTSVLEHASFQAVVTCDRGISHELVRHRIASYSQESTRYCAYAAGLRVVRQPGVNDEHLFKVSQMAYEGYQWMLEQGYTPQLARCALPHSTATEIVMTMNLRAWRNFFQQRCPVTAHPAMRVVANSLLKTLTEAIPVVFDDIKLSSDVQILDVEVSYESEEEV